MGSSSYSYSLPLHCLSVGDSILVYWDGDRRWYPAEITAAEGDHRSEVLYRDGEREWLSLDETRFIVQRDRGGAARGGRGKRPQAEPERQIEEAKNVLLDIEDRLPLEGVHENKQEWWEVWHDDILQAVEKNDIQGLKDATLSLSLQLKPHITSRWWVKHNADWKKRLEKSATILDVASVVKELQNNAIDWSVARKLFSGCQQSVPFPDAEYACSKGKNDDGFCRMKDSSKLGSSFLRKDCSMEVVGYRRSNRLKRKSTLEDTTLSSKCFVERVERGECMDAPCLDIPSPPRKETLMDRSDGKNHGSARRGDAHHRKQKKRRCISREAEYLDETASRDDDSPDEKSADDTVNSGIHGLVDGLLCSVCQIGVSSDSLIQCKKSGCFRAFHIFCLCPPLHKIEKDWVCPYCEEVLILNGNLSKDRLLNPKKIQSLVGHRTVIFECQEKVLQTQFLIKWQSLSHHHDSWVPLEWLDAVDRARLRSYQKKFPISKEAVLVDQRKSDWFEIDRVIACRKKFASDKSCEIWKISHGEQGDDSFEFLVKWKGLDYCDATWESSCTEELLAEVGRLVRRHQRAIEGTDNDGVASGNTLLNKELEDLFGGILYDYQLQGLNWILSNFKARRNVILADEMGLGKTVQVVSFICYMKQKKLNVHPVLIIAPKSILFQWEKEFRHWARDLNVIIYQGEKHSRRCIQEHEMYSSGKRVLFDALVTNYELVLLDSSILRKFRWSAIIIDEAHKIKRLDCKLAGCLKRCTSDFRLLLTGTPLQNNLLELFALLHFIDPKEFSDPRGEAESFSTIEKGQRHAELEMKVAQIHEILRPRMLRRMKSDVLPKSIPVKKWVEVPCALTDSQRELYINILEKNYKALNKEIQNGRKIILNFILMELRKCCNHPYIFPGQERYHSSKEAAFLALVATSGKLQLLEKLLPKLKERGNRVLLFSQMTKMLDILEDFLVSLGLSYYRIDGSTSIAARQQQMKEFNSPTSEVFIFLISTRAGGLGIDLPSADRVIIYDPDFNPFMDLQAQSRAHRIGQTRPVVVYQLITKCSVEEKILWKSKQKLAMENLVMNRPKPTVGELHSVLLHGACKILNRKNLNATSIQYDGNAIENLLRLDPAPDEKCSLDENGYLGSIQSFIPGAGDSERPPSPRAEEWKEILGPVVTDKAYADFGRGKRQKKAVKYESEDGSDSDEVYSPDSSSSNGDSSEESECDLEPAVASEL